MATNISASLDFLKNQALSVIVPNMQIKFPAIKKALDDHISKGGSNFKSLVSLLSFNKNVLTSSTVSAVLLLAYLDFYAMYTILYSNLPVFENLKIVSQSKYAYIYDLYKELTATVKNKTLLQSYSYSRFIDFLAPREINNQMSGYMARDHKITKPLNFIDVLSLPIKSSEIVKPAYITFVEIDSSFSESDSTIKEDGFQYDLTRYQNNKIGIAEKNIAVPMGANVKYGVNPEVSGTIFGYFADKIYITVSKLEFNLDNTLKNIYIVASTTGHDWSDESSSGPGSKLPILIEDNIEVGLYITFFDGFGLTEGDRFIVSVINSNIESPIVKLKINFDILEPISYIKYFDISSYKLPAYDIFIDRDKFGDNIRQAQMYDSRIGQILVSGGSVDELSLSFKQEDFDVKSNEGRLCYSYNFNISDIKGFVNEYESHGTLVFNPIQVENINTVTVGSEEYVPDYGVHSVESPAPPRSMIEYNIIAENEAGRVIIPALHKNFTKDNDNLYAWDLIIPNTINENQGATTFWGTAYYKPRFPVNWESGLDRKVYNPFFKTEMDDIVYNAQQNIFVIMGYIYTNSQIAWYPIVINKVQDISEITLSNKWIKASNTIYYMYFIDEESTVHLALRELDLNTKTLKPFTGKVYGQIEMRTMDQPWITPMIFNYSISCV